MADLSAQVGTLALCSPILAAAGPLTETGENMRACLAGGAAAVVARTVSSEPAPTLPARQTTADCAPRGSLLTTELWSPRAIAEHLPDYVQVKAAGVPLIISLGYTADHVLQAAPVVRPFADAVEISTLLMADDTQVMVRAVLAARAALDVPVWVKLTALGRDVVGWARAAKDAGADAIVAMGGFGPCLAVDAESGRTAFPETGGYAWLSGVAVKNIALRCVWDIARQVDIPVIGCGGAARGADVVEYLMAGASAVQVCTAALLHGPQVFGKICQELADWMGEHGHPSVEALRGYAVRRMEGRQVRTKHLPPDLDVAACIGCEICPTSCVYGALEMVGERKTPSYKVRLLAERCWGCGLCATRCPVRALRIPGVSSL